MQNDQKQAADWHTFTGNIPFRMTNDYLFRALMQENNDSLVALIANLLGWQKNKIISASIENPIQLGTSITKKDYILDVKVLLNNSMIMNLEMQVINEHNWPERSLLYLCRAFDSLNRGESYEDVKSAYHIGFTDFNPFPDEDEFYASYALMNTKTSREYTDKFKLFVVCLTCIDKATVEDRRNHLDEWASMFKAQRWEELQMLAQQNPDIDNAVTKIYSMSQDDMIYEQMRAREDYYANERYRQKKDAERLQEIAELRKELAEKDALIKQLQSQIETK